ncbi:MAG: hypothetical protein ACRDTQ_19965 [Micromonosporaceae bacterium]
MGVFSDLLEGMDIAARSPDGKIQWELRDGKEVNFFFVHEKSYESYTEGGLEYQLTALVHSIWEGHRQAHTAVLREELDHLPEDEYARGDSRDREFYDERSKVCAQGKSGTGRVSVSSTGTTSWDVSIKDGTIAKLTEEQFLYEVWSAIVATRADFGRKMNRLKRNIYRTRIANASK